MVKQRTVQWESDGQLATTLNRQPFKPVNNGNPTATPSASTVSLPQTKLIDLNYDCLEHILRGFSLADLIDIGGTCTHLQSEVHRYFRTKYRKHTVFIDCERYPSYSISSQAGTDKGNDIGSFMFVFGAVVSKLAIINMCPVNHVDAERMESDTVVQHLVDGYCRKNLREISFRYCGKLIMSHAKPFEEVTKVSFDHCILGEKVADFAYLFPKLRKLDLIDCIVQDVREIIEK